MDNLKYKLLNMLRNSDKQLWLESLKQIYTDYYEGENSFFNIHVNILKDLEHYN